MPPDGSDDERLRQYMESNRRRWNEATPVHARSDFYDVEGFKRGKLTLMPIEREELGDVAGKSLLHLQCHFGLDTMSWARLGARVIGVDFSEEAIDLARSLSMELGIEAEFVHANVYDLASGNWHADARTCGKRSEEPSGGPAAFRDGNR